MARFALRVFRSLGFLRVVARRDEQVSPKRLLPLVMIVAEQVLDAAIRRRQQPKRDTSRRSDAESERKLLLAVRHAFSPLNCPRDCHACTQGYLLVHGINVLCFRLACCWRPADSLSVQNAFPAIRTDANPKIAPARVAPLWGETPISWIGARSFTECALRHCSGTGRVRERRCRRSLPSEPDVRVSPHPAQAEAKPRASGAGVTTV